MGNLVETANFVKNQGHVGECDHVVEKRSDTIYLQTTKTIEITSISLSSCIEGSAKAYLMISETATEKELLNQTIELITSATRFSSYYELHTPIKLNRGQYYTFHVEVYGGPTYTYIEMSHYSTQRNLTIELTRDIPFVGRVISASDAGFLEYHKINTESSTSSPKNSRRVKRLHSLKIARNDSESLELTKRKFVKTAASGQDEIKELSPKRSSSRVSSMKLSSSPLSKGKWTRLLRREKTHKMNLISGINFSQSLELNVCCS